MKNISRLLVLFSICFILASIVSAVGIKWYTESETITENSEKCVMYGAYNPSANDIKVKIEVTESLKEIVTNAQAEEKIIKAKTPSAQAEDVKFCFTVPQVYKQDCLLGNFVCAQKCDTQQKVYYGEIIMTEESVASEGGAAGSGVSIAASAPLALSVQCNAHPRDWTLVYMLAIIVVILILIALLYKKYRTPKVERDRLKLRKLQEKVAKESKSTRKK